MFEAGFLAGNAVYASVAHTPEVLEPYFDVFGQVLSEIAQKSDQALRAELPQGPTVRPFGRLA
jgi:hypothetical protein